MEMCRLILAVLLVAPFDVWGNILSQSQKDLILKLHNDFRRKEHAANMLELKWSTKAEQAADDWVQQCKDEHQNKNWGENLAFNANPENATVDAKIIAMHNDWHSEKKGYTFGPSCFPYGACHYTQLVWAETSDVGCSLKQCNPLYSPFAPPLTRDDTYFIVCFYEPRANWQDSNNPHGPYIQGDPCSKCPTGTSCQNGLCSGTVSGGEQGNTGSNTGDNTGDNTGSNTGDNTGDNTGSNTGGSTGGNTGGATGGSTNQGPVPNTDNTGPSVNVGDKLTDQEKLDLLAEHNKIRGIKGKPFLKWDVEAMGSAITIVNCKTQYPGITTDSSNYAKIKSGSFTPVIERWGQEKETDNLNGNGCVAINNDYNCNHLLNIIGLKAEVNLMGCAAKSCGEEGRQLACVYRHRS